jgi:hypothetical protein
LRILEITMLVRILTTFSVLLFVGNPAFAADPEDARLEAVLGKVLVNQGKGFSVAKDNLLLKIGSTIMVGEDGGATLVFPATKTAAACSVELQPVSVITVSGPAMCAEDPGTKVKLFEQPTITPTATDATPGGIPPAVVGVGAFGAALAVGAYVILDGNDNNASIPVSAP